MKLGPSLLVLGTRCRLSLLSNILRKPPRRYMSDTLEDTIPNSMHKIVYFTMPEIMGAKDGKVRKWVKNEGEAFNEGETICELVCSGVILALETERPGILVQRLTNEGQVVDVKTPIASYVLDKQAYLSYVENKQQQAIEASMLESTLEVKEEESKKPNSVVLMREIKHLIQEGKIDDTSEYAKKLQSLARQGNKELLDIFQASFDGIAFDKESFDVQFFLDNSKSLVNELLPAK